MQPSVCLISEMIFLRKKFDGMKYDLRRVEEVYYDVKIRGLAATGDAIGEQGIEGQS